MVQGGINLFKPSLLLPGLGCTWRSYCQPGYSWTPLLGVAVFDDHTSTQGWPPGPHKLHLSSRPSDPSTEIYWRSIGKHGRAWSQTSSLLVPSPWPVMAFQLPEQFGSNAFEIQEMLPLGYVGRSQKIGRSPQSSKILGLRKPLCLMGSSAATQIREFSSNLTGMISSSCKQKSTNPLLVQWVAFCLPAANSWASNCVIISCN